jgi:hypothetical protein
MGKLEGRRPLRLGRPRCKWVDNIKIDPGEMVWLVWIELVWFRIGIVESSCEYGNEPPGIHKMLGNP